MCLEFPGCVTALDGDVVTVETAGRKRRALALLFPDLRRGDWVLVAAGTVVSRLNPDEAAQLTADVSAAKGDTT
jgi:hydrogenase assembly chaperone HypC/HupF